MEIYLPFLGLLLIDIEDYSVFINRKWYLHTKGYLVCIKQNTGHLTRIEYLHRLILNPQKGQIVDHVNGNPLDNRRCNLRVCSQSLNVAKGRKRNNTSSKFKGVYWDRCRGKWKAAINAGGNYINLGHFTDELEAAQAYRNAAIKYYKEDVTILERI